MKKSLPNAWPDSTFAFWIIRGHFYHHLYLHFQKVLISLPINFPNLCVWQLHKNHRPPWTFLSTHLLQSLWVFPMGKKISNFTGICFIVIVILASVGNVYMYICRYVCVHGLCMYVCRHVCMDLNFWFSCLYLSVHVLLCTMPSLQSAGHQAQGFLYIRVQPWHQTKGF